MRYLKTFLTGWCLLAYLQSTCLPVDLILSGLQLTEERHACRCKLTGLHDDWCRCPCCVEERAEEMPSDARSCCPAEKGTSAQYCLVQAGCGARDDFSVSSPRLSLYLCEEAIGLETTASVRRPVDCRVRHPYSICPNLPDKIPI